MKLTVSFLLYCCCLPSFGQIYNYNATTAYFMDRVKIAANEDSRIEIRGRDTLLIARFEYINPQNQSRQFAERVYLGTPYWRNGWFSTALELPQGKPVKGILAYNLQQQKVYFSTSPEKAAQEVKPSLFTLLGTTFTLGPDGQYYQVIESQGPWKALKKYTCEYSPLKPTDRTGYELSGGEFEGEYKKTTAYYLQRNAEVYRIRRGTKWTKGLDSDREKIETFSKKIGGNLQQDSQMKALVHHLGIPH